MKCWFCDVAFDCGDQTYKDLLGYKWHARCFTEWSDAEGDADYV